METKGTWSRTKLTVTFHHTPPPARAPHSPKMTALQIPSMYQAAFVQPDGSAKVKECPIPPIGYSEPLGQISVTAVNPADWKRTPYIL